VNPGGRKKEPCFLTTVWFDFIFATPLPFDFLDLFAELGRGVTGYNFILHAAGKNAAQARLDVFHRSRRQPFRELGEHEFFDVPPADCIDRFIAEGGEDVVFEADLVADAR
jgi:hypothetical protein